MIELAKLFIPALFNIKSNPSSRAHHVINLGVTDLKVHQHKRTSITGNQGLSLISTWSKKVKITHDAKTELGKFMQYMINDVIPNTTMPDSFSSNITSIDQEYLQLFAKQLNITNNEDLDVFNIPAISLLINNDLNPHCDSSNPISSQNDITLSITVQVPITSLPKATQTILPKGKFTTSIPFCVVLYRRQCLVNLSKREIKINKY